MTWLGWLNFLLLRWSRVRLARTRDARTQRFAGFVRLGPIVPLTGRWNDYRRVRL